MPLSLSTIIIISILSIQKNNGFILPEFDIRKDLIKILKHVGNQELLEPLKQQLIEHKEKNGPHLHIAGHDITISRPTNQSYCKFDIRTEKEHTGFRIGQSRDIKRPRGTNLTVYKKITNLKYKQ